MLRNSGGSKDRECLFERRNPEPTVHRILPAMGCRDDAGGLGDVPMS
ncbi:MAG: hypothetical protein AAGJ40_12690 [Planctomycetota bacterium]